MSLSSVDLWQRISAAGLASPMQCRSLAAEAAKSLTATDSENGLLVLQELVTLGKLTKYQAKVLAGQADWPLERNGWAILDRVKHSVWSGWFKVTKIDLTKAEQPSPKWVRWLTTNELDGLSQSAPSLQRALQLAQVTDASIQQTYVPELQQDSTLEMLVDPVDGELLSNLKKARLSIGQILDVIEAIANGLSSLHQKTLIHGRILPDRISLSESEHGWQPTILIDSLCRIQAEPSDQLHGLLATDLGDLQQNQFLAPEYLAPGQGPTKATDVYSLGCIWYWLVTGEPPFTSNSIAAHAESKVDMSRVKLESPYARCLEHCLGKNPKSRFADATKLVAALQQCRSVVQRGKVAVATEKPKPVEPEAGNAIAEKSKSKAKPVGRPIDESSDVTKEQRQALVAKKAQAQKPQGKDTEKAKTATESSSINKPAALGSKKPEPAVEKRKTTKKTAATRKAPVQKTKTVPSSNQTEDQHQPAAETNKSPAEIVAKHVETDAQKALEESQQPKDSEPQLNETIEHSEEEQSDNQSKASIQPVTKKVSKSSVSRRPQSGSRKQRGRRKKKNNLLLPIGGACGFLVLLLGILKFSGALEPGQSNGEDQDRPAYSPQTKAPPVPVAKDEREEFFAIQQREGIPWLPPHQPNPFPRDLLPPGAQLLVSLRPAEIIAAPGSRSVVSALGDSASTITAAVSKLTKTDFANIEHVVIGFYEPVSENQFPLLSARVKLVEAAPLSTLKNRWKADGKKAVGEATLLVGENNDAFYVEQQPLVDAQSVSEYSIGPLALMQEMVEFGGGPAPLNTQLNRLWQASDQQLMVSILASPRFLFANGRGVFNSTPARLTDLLKANFGTDTRGVLVQTDFDEGWYGELQVVPGSDQDAPRVASTFANKLESLPDAIEAWFVEESPHPYWRALAFRFPQMIRAIDGQTRSGVENGKAVLNFYMPDSAAPNLLLAGWIAMQDAATMSGSVAQSAGQATSAKPLSKDEFLGLKMEVSFDQEPIENALALIGEDANGTAPAGTKPVEFVLDGDAFEKAGITRNQQLSNFNMSGRSLREALTEVAKRGNPVTTVTDTREADQRLIWVTVGDPVEKVLLTTRQAATEAKIELPREFAPEN